MAATATAAKTREVTYYRMVGTAAGPKTQLTASTTKALGASATTLAALAKADSIFPAAQRIALALERFLADPSISADKAFE